MNKKGLALNDLQWLICSKAHPTKMTTNQNDNDQ